MAHSNVGIDAAFGRNSNAVPSDRSGRLQQPSQLCFDGLADCMPASRQRVSQLKARRQGVTVKAGSTLRAIAPCWPASHGESPEKLQFPKLINMAISRLIAIAGNPEDRRYKLLASMLPVLARNEDGKRQERQKLKRSEGMKNALTYLTELVGRSDETTGFVARPPACAGQRWERFTQKQLGTFAFGRNVPGEVGPSRGKRADQGLKEIGFIQRKQPRRKVFGPQGVTWRNDVSIVHVTRRFWAWLGLMGELTQHLRNSPQRVNGEARTRQFQPRGNAKSPQRPYPAAVIAHVKEPVAPVERSDRPPPRPSTPEFAAERIAEVQRLIRYGST